MKKLKKVILISIMLLYVLSIKTFAETGKVNIEATRIREENNTTSEILTVIYEDDEVEILETKGEWLKIKYKEHTGYVMKKYIDISNSTNTSKNTTSNNTTQNTTKKDTSKNTVSNNTTAKNEVKNETKNETKNTTSKNETQKDQVSVYDNNSNTNLDKNSKIELKVDSELRIQPNIMSKKTDKLTAGIELTIKEKMGKWIQVTEGTVTGWILDTKILSEQNNQNVNTSDIDNDKQNTTNTTNTATNKTNTASNKTNTTTNKVSNETTTNTTTSTSNVSKKGTINVETAKVRKEPSTTGSLIDFLDYGDEVSITKESGDWYYVKHQNIEGYVSKRLITLKDEDVSSRSLNEERKENENAEEQTKETNEETSTNGNEIAEYAKKFIGTSYVLGGKTPEAGFDCSGFTRYVYKNFGYSLSSTSSGQASVGTEISRENIKPGDLIIFYNEEKTKVGHTGIYIGNGDFVHSANPERGVVTDNLNTNTYYNERYISARRLGQ